jgi:hypothetical protein
MSFKNAVLNTEVDARTENGMRAIASSLNKNTDLFFKIGASRGQDISKAFMSAFVEDNDLALRIALWARDARSGAGERQLFRDILLLLEKDRSNVLLNTNLLAKVPELGRWDDLLIFTDEKVCTKAFDLIEAALATNNGLCAKWMPRKGPIANKLRTYFGWTPKFYRKRLVELTKVVETQMCSKQWETITFDHVPSVAMARYNKAFYKNAPVSFKTYKEKLVKGEAKINASAVFPYDIIKTIRAGGDTVVADAQWDALPNYMGDAQVLPMVDVSGSMHQPAGKNANVMAIDVALSLGLYCADKNKGAFKDLFLTFSRVSKFEHLKGSLSQKMNQMDGAHWDMSTNLHGAFEEILKVAVKNKVSEDSMPKAMLILSDMQFDQCAQYDDTAYKMIERKYADAGYKMPGIVFWNICAHDNAPVRFDAKGTALVSGFSPSIMKSVLAADFSSMTPEAIMKQTVLVDRYDYL